MIQLEFHQGSGIAIGADCYRFAERIRDRHRTPLFRHVKTEAPRTISDRELVDMLGRSELQILTPGEMAEVEETGEPPKGPNLITLDDIKSDWERARVRKYEPYLQGWVRAGVRPCRITDWVRSSLRSPMSKATAHLRIRARSEASSKDGTHTDGPSTVWSAAKRAAARVLRPPAPYVNSFSM